MEDVQQAHKDSLSDWLLWLQWIFWRQWRAETVRPCGTACQG